MASVIGKDSFTLAEFLDSRDFVLCNKVQYIINGVYLADCEWDNDWSYCNVADEEYFEPYQWWLTTFNEDDVAKLNRDYGLKFIYCEALDNWVFINDFCFGMSFSDFVIKKIEQEA